jgi:GNAT superfamily N-acetyltransferase
MGSPRDTADSPGAELTLRQASSDDIGQVIDVCGRALAWSDDDVDADFFRWKHIRNAFGPSAIWVAVDDVAPGSPIVGVRAMMRWDLEGPGGATKAMTRAVDTATLPSYQGQGIFRRLTLAAVDQLTRDGMDAVFNTPNDKSRPGYLKMGWQTVGKVPVTIRPRNPIALASMARSRVAADKWGTETDVGLDPLDALRDTEAVEAAIAEMSPPAAWSTPLSASYLRWRTGFRPLACRIEPLGESVGDGFVVFRLRRRGVLLQLSILHAVGPPDAGPVRRAIRRLLAATGADVALASGRRLGGRHLLAPLPGAGPLLTWRPLGQPGVITMDDLDLSLGAIELF